MFAAVAPKLAVIYHYKDSTGMMDAVRAGYTGRVVLATDLMSIHIGQTVDVQ